MYLFFNVKVVLFIALYSSQNQHAKLWKHQYFLHVTYFIPSCTNVDVCCMKTFLKVDFYKYEFLQWNASQMFQHDMCNRQLFPNQKPNFYVKIHRKIKCSSKSLHFPQWRTSRTPARGDWPAIKPWRTAGRVLVRLLILLKWQWNILSTIWRATRVYWCSLSLVRNSSTPRINMDAQKDCFLIVVVVIPISAWNMMMV